MATKIESELPPSSANESDPEDPEGLETAEDPQGLETVEDTEGLETAEDQDGEASGEDPDGVGSSFEDEEKDEKPPVNANFAQILARLQSSGALIKLPKQEYRCVTCDIEFDTLDERDKHLIQHVTLPVIELTKLPSDDEDTSPSGDENWSDEEEMENPPKTVPKAPQKIDISQILQKTGLSIKKPGDNDGSSGSALNKLSGLGFTIKKGTVAIKTEKPDTEPDKEKTDKNNDVMQRLEKLGGIKLKLRSDGSNTNSFKVVNGLKDFKASDDEDEASGNDEGKDDQEDDDEQDKSGDQEASGGEQDSPDEQENSNSRKTSESDDSDKNRKITNLPKCIKIQSKQLTPKKEPPKTPVKVQAAPVKPQENQQQSRPPNRPTIKQTPKRAPSSLIASKDQASNESPASRRSSTSHTPERRQSNDRVENVVVKQEHNDSSTETTNSSIMPLFSNQQIKSERTSPPLTSVSDSTSTPILARVKSEPEPASTTTASQPLFNYQSSNTSTSQSSVAATPVPTTPLPPVTKTEDSSMTIIEINGDSNDEDDDCCVVSATPAPDVKPVIPKVENPPPPLAPASFTSSYSSSQSSYNSAPSLSSRLTAPSTEKQHNFNWNAPDSKPPIDLLEKSADDIFESLLSSSTKKENMSLSDASEYISLDTLGPQHSCEVCNTRFTNIALLEEHKRMTGHSTSLVAPSSSNLLPYNPSSNILSSLLPVKQLAEQVGKLSTMGNNGSGFTHQQNVMINIQAYPGAGGVMVPPNSYNAYPPGQNMHAGYPQGNMYPGPGQQMPGQYQGNNYMGQGYGQYPPMSKPAYPGAMPPTSYASASSPYSTASPLQSMQQAVYGQSPGGMMNQQPMTMGPPGSSPGQPYVPSSSPSAMKPPSSGIRIQNVQTFPAPGQPFGQGQSPGQDSNQMPPPAQPVSGPTPIRMAAGANIAGPRVRMPGVRAQRPTIRPGIQVHGQVRGGKITPRMPMKRPGGMGGGPVQKRRSDMLLPGKHDNEDCQVMAMQKQRDGLPMIQSVQGAKDKLNLGGQISITKKTVNKEANAMANVLASRGISIKQKQKSRSPTPERPIPHIPNLGAGVSIKHTSKPSNFSIPEAKVGGGGYPCKICRKMFMNPNSLQVHMSNVHPQSKIPVYKCDECPASYPKSLQLQHHKRVFHNVTGPNRELGLPVVDLSQEDNLKRLSNLGIYSFIPLANREHANGCFGIPVISVHNVQNGLTTSLQALGADGLLSLGPLKPLPNS